MAKATNTLSLPTGQRLSSQTDPHVAWWAEAERLRAQINAGGLDEDEAEDLLDTMFELEALIARTPAQTLPGILCQVRYLALAATRGEGPDQEAAFKAVPDALERLIEKAEQNSTDRDK